MTQRTRVVGYVRVSTTGQAEEGVSLAAQREAIEEHARMHGFHLIDVIEDAGVSGKTLERAGLQDALARLKRGEAGALIVMKLDRLARSVVGLGQLVEKFFARENGPALVSTSENIDTRSASGRLVLHVLSSVAQWEREAIAERTSVALRHKAARGEFTGGAVPYGYKLDRGGGHLEPHEDEQPVLAAVVRLRGKKLSLRGIARALDQRGMRSRTGRPFEAVQISRMLRDTARRSAGRSST